MTRYSIGDLAQRAGVAIDTIRYYERDGLLAPAERSAAGYRRYDDTGLKRLTFIRRAKALGFSLEDIRGLLALSEQADIAEVRRTAQGKLADIEQRIAELERIRAGLRALIAACPGHGRAEACPILNALTGDAS
ncbi:MAG TPA: heavy metal-responsive transcriptional regulator [Tahibacter sp.]|uniref:heavy metal-responsive transcriptional regulator n=1 Tax=Tahibacter sp. TaxID=2056211 RepID=UPI002B8CBF60|nr:heavy metal-responsive transcriptional regulator [Tahibacter sp.]HSX59157.1 heavy metal-responsive transcriptional regulator [Tahibacter sp.]